MIMVMRSIKSFLLFTTFKTVLRVWLGECGAHVRIVTFAFITALVLVVFVRNNCKWSNKWEQELGCNHWPTFGTMHKLCTNFVDQHSSHELEARSRGWWVTRICSARWVLTVNWTTRKMGIVLSKRNRIEVYPLVSPPSIPLRLGTGLSVSPSVHSKGNRINK